VRGVVGCSDPTAGLPGEKNPNYVRTPNEEAVAVALAEERKSICQQPYT
jgi:hypothetical protein